ncbi:MAG TPA: 2TM domain-containing protein [Glaciihabitans sp.]|jgi:fatty acid desaturase|nr:2TM domain-containing protein [Glaciihabitans sp.]
MTDQSDERSDEQWVDPATLDADRTWARKRLERKRELVNHLLIYAIVNAFLVAVWAFTGAGYFWPGWVLLGWGVFFVADASELMYRRGITDADIDRELRRHNR